ncbi:uncharacterized protein LOC126954577 isoform X2 [Macaca thibetana thibetana]|uniref:uncharacterized protein LOC126954577 isoform X2 n=1 Tax=Macaca thibetana thibetana TaxID=257877 RepID=UPI0021BC7DE6|nr:uncharacterized protein LOC126954577 isoform X2 [Macaca thibetana thibetana]
MQRGSQGLIPYPCEPGPPGYAPTASQRLLDATIELPYCFSWFERTRWKQTGQANERLWGLWELSVYENHIPEKNIVLGHSKRQTFWKQKATLTGNQIYWHLDLELCSLQNSGRHSCVRSKLSHNHNQVPAGKE